MEFPVLNTLSDHQRVILGMLSYCMMPLKKNELLFACQEILPGSTKEYNTALDKLVDDNYLRYQLSNIYWGDYCYLIENRWVGVMLLYMMQDHTEWMTKFQKLFAKRKVNKEQRDAVLKLMRKAYDGQQAELPVSVSPGTIQTLLTPIYTNVEYAEVAKFLPKSIYYNILRSESPNWYIIDDVQNIDYIADTLSRLSAQEVPDCGDVLGELQLAYYLQHGSMAEEVKGTVPPYYMNLIYSLQYAEKEDFAEARRWYEKTYSSASSAHSSEYGLLNFYYVLLLLKMNNPQDAELLSKFRGRELRYKEATREASILSQIVTADTNEIPKDDLKYSFKQEASRPQFSYFSSQMALLLCQVLSLSKEEVEILCGKGFKVADFEPKSFIIKLMKEWLGQLTIKPAWQRAIEKVMAQEDKLTRPVDETKVGTDVREERFAFFFNPRGKAVEVRLQKRLKSGRWSSGTVVNEQNLTHDGKAERDEWDLKLAELIDSHYYFSGFTISQVLPQLEGCDKFYVGNSAPYARCLIREDKPFLEAKIGRKGIALSSNVPLKQLSENRTQDLLYNVQILHSGQTESGYDGEVTYFRLPARVRSYLKTLLEIGTFPLEAEPVLRPMLDRIKSLIEIHSEMVEGGSTLPQIEGNPQIFLQLRQQKSCYEMRALCRPLAEGRITVNAGSGDTNIYDATSDGTRYHVVRDKKLEKKNLQPLRDFLEQHNLEEDSTCNWTLDPFSLLELLEWLPEQGDDYVVEWPEGDKINLRTASTSQWNVRLNRKGDWFEVEGEVPIDEKTIITFAQLLEMVEEGRGRFIRLENGDYLSLSDSLRRQLRRIDAVAQNVRGHARISNVGASLIADAMQGALTIDHPAELDKLRQLINESQDLQADVPQELNATLRDYQIEGFRWMDRLSHWGAGACLADDMGLGKTIQTIAFLLYKQQGGASLVVAPASVVPNWKKEVAHFAPTLQVVVLNELSSADRKEAIAQAAEGSLIITTYGLLISEEEAFVAKKWNVVCLDEAHSIKNATTKTSAVCMQLQATHRLILTGTPIQNHLGELWNLFQFINPGLLGSLQQFTKKFINPIEGGHDQERQQQLKRIIQPFMLRRTKQEVVSELPDKQEIMLPVELSEEEMAIYETLRLEAKSQLEAELNGPLSVNTLAMITRLRMAACAASLAQKQWIGSSSKLDAFCNLVSEISSTGNRVLVFSQFTSFLEMAKAELQQRGMSDFLYLDGTTPLKKRSQMVDDFQHGKCPIFIISLKAGGLGLNLTGANYVIHLDPWWNPAIEQQATDRAYRIGQNQKVTVYHLISSHTIEEKIVRLHQTKRDLADSLLEGTDVSHKLRAEDLLQMIDF